MNNQSANERRTRTWLTAVDPFAIACTVNPEMNIPRIAHRAVATRATRDMKIDTLPQAGIILTYDVPNRAPNPLPALHLYSNREFTLA
jgi:hypothetical protein